MKVTKYGFFLAVMIYMGVQVVTHFGDNTKATGHLSQLYLLWSFADIVLLYVTFVQFAQTARGRIVTHQDAVAIDANEEIDLNIAHFGFTTYAYYVIIVGYMAFNCYQHVMANTDNTGIVSIWYGLWAFADVILAAISVQQLFLIATGKQLKLVKNSGTAAKAA